MKKTILLSLAVILAVGYWGCKDSESGSPTSPSTTVNYFPNNEGTNYKYSYSKTDSSGTVQGTRTAYYHGTKTVSGTLYKIQIDSLNLGSSSQVDSSYFRTTEAGAYYYLDTTGFVESISDPSLIPLIPYVVIDKELLAYSFPLQAGKIWPVFKINLTAPVAATVVDVSALVVGSETITLNLPSGPTNKDAMKVKFTLTLRLNPFSPLQVQSFTADAWLIADIGPAKWDGSGTIVNFFTGAGIDFGDTTNVVKQSLTYYDIK
jgi:hypothetical protein